MKLSREEVLNKALLARIGLSDEDVEKFREQLSNILENFTILQEVDTSDVPATAQSVDLKNVMRDDVVMPSSSQEEILMNAPRREDDFFRVKAVLEQEG
ncbi:MAG: Asp-tRNA(Asn)/Glu-tRNA(Gln) amidotransferase subunit GatC [Dehalococcoidia bacterium]|nr:Asp-tRNA(Asn)/Glu-tRNA(Gln) amidotransferase subunit GatC [Dehalococcoidia bacterium]MDZ4245860.1 Asp-tRNA(Asn)/Glu-tRNA(Gln) amidotransferase subunit GatC [Dehalococcoidia bacterium]